MTDPVPPRAGPLAELAALAARLCGVPAARILQTDGDASRKIPETHACRLDIPIQTASGRTLGTLSLFDDAEPDPTPDQSDILGILARQAAALMELSADAEPKSPTLDEQSEAAEKLRESEERFRAFMDHSPLMAFIKDENNRLLYINRFMSKLLGIDPDRLDLLRDLETAHPDVSDIVREMDDSVLGNDKAFEYIERIPKPDGAMRTWRINKFPFHGKNGQRLIGGISLDITERETAEARLRVFADIFRNIQVGIFVWHMEGPPESAEFRLLATNAAASRMTGLSIDDVIGKTMQEAFPGIFTLGFGEKCRQAILTGESIDLGDVVYGESHAPRGSFTAKIVPLPNDTVAIAFENVTEERRNREVLRQSIERFELIARATNDAVWEKKPATGETWWNERAYQMFGFDAAKASPGLDAWQDRIHPEDRECVLADFRRISEGDDDTWVREYRFLRPEGGAGHIYERGFVLRGENGVPVRILGAMMDITDLKRAEEAVRESEEKYRKLVEVSPDVIAIGLERKVAYINRAGLEMYGASDPEEMVGRPMLDFFHPDSKESVVQRIAHLESGGEIPPMELKVLRKDGSFIEAESRAFAFSYRGKLAYLAVIRDITDRKRAEADLRGSEERYRTLVAVSPVGLYRVGPDGMLAYVNEYYCRTTGRTQEDLVGTYGGDVLHPDDLGWVVETWEKAASLGVQFHAEYRFIHTDGSIVWVMGRALPDRTSDGVILGFVGTITDITERKQAEILLACQKRTLAMVASGSPMPEVMESLVKNVETESTGMGGVLQLDPESGRLSWLAAPAIPETLRRLAPSFPMDATGGALALSATSRKYALCADIALDAQAGPELGRVLAHGLRACASRPILGSRGQVLGVFAFFYPQAGGPAPYDLKLMDTASDLAAIAIERSRQEEIDRKNQELSELNRRIQEASRMKSEFLANMSHELRTPLNAIIGFSQLLLDAKVGPVNGKQGEFLRDILDGGMHLLRLINDVLDLAKIEAGKMQVFPEEINLPQTMREVCDILLPMALGKSVTLRTESDPSLEIVRLDGQKIRQVLYNLVSNAIKFSKTGGRVRVKARLEKSGDVRILVIDQGIGIRKEDIGKLFQQFQQLDTGSSRHYSGTGLGLVITKKLVELHRGTVEVESEPGCGSIFSCVFPQDAQVP